MMKAFQGENILLHERLNMKKIKSPKNVFSCCVPNKNMESRDAKYTQSNTARTLSDEKGNNICQVVASKGEEKYHHPNARRTSPVEPWRKVYVQDIIVKE